MAATTSGWPYVVPADHPLEYPNASQAAANLLETRLKDLVIRAKVLTGQATDGNGITTISAAALGLTTVLGGIASPHFGTAVDGSVAHFCATRMTSNALNVISMYATAATGGQVSRFANKTGLTLYVIAWGT